MARVLVVEDEVKLASSVKRGLEGDGFAVDLAHDGLVGLAMAQERTYDGIVLDLMLPGLDGHQVCRSLRGLDDWTPILVLTARETELDETGALDAGADDFLRKPVSHVVLVARLRALMRRGTHRRPVELQVADLVLDPRQRRVWRGDREVELTTRELSVLEYLIRNRGTVVSKQDILDNVWDFDFAGDPNIVEVYVRHLRRKLDEPFGRSSIQTVRGAGYRLDPAR